LIDKEKYYKTIIWIPADSAFSKLQGGQVRFILRNRRIARDIVLYHIALGYYLMQHLEEKWVYAFKTMASGKHKLRMRKMGDDVTIFNPGGKANARIVRSDINAKNGLMNIVDQVLIPESIGKEIQRRRRR